MAMSALKKTAFDNHFKMDPAEAKTLVDSLTPRERQVAERIAMGMPQDDIAKDLDIAVKTLDIFRANVRCKFRTATHGIARVWFCALTASE
jgi:FixJ family two-component response regulator